MVMGNLSGDKKEGITGAFVIEGENENVGRLMISECVCEMFVLVINVLAHYYS